MTYVFELVFTSYPDDVRERVLVKDVPNLPEAFKQAADRRGNGSLRSIKLVDWFNE